MGVTNLDALTATTGTFTTGTITNLTAAGGLIAVDTVTATSAGDLPVTSVAVGDVVVGAYSDTGAFVTPGTITAGHVASDASSTDGVVVVWMDLT